MKNKRKEKRNRRATARFSDIVRVVDKVLPVTKADIGGLIRFYDGGWYTGYVLKVGKSDVTIQPIGPEGKKPHPVRMKFEDVKILRGENEFKDKE